YPAINWMESYSEYVSDLSSWYKTNVDPKFMQDRTRIVAILNAEDKLMETVKLIGADVLPEDQKLLLEVARVIRLGFLQQNAYHKEDQNVPAKKQFLMMETILYLYDKAQELIRAGHPMSILKADGIFEKVIAIKYDVPNANLERFTEYREAIDAFIRGVLEKNG
ncbi:MAG: ATP synthase beta subunit C-terminal domain-containing protein, partial [bacterium]